MLVKAGEENAGLMDIGDRYGVVFKIESHNHPSAIEPFQGAATGVGGINRDIFTMGARPIASLNSLRFGNLQEAKTHEVGAQRHTQIDDPHRQLEILGDLADLANVPNQVGAKRPDHAGEQRAA